MSILAWIACGIGLHAWYTDKTMKMWRVCATCPASQRFLDGKYRWTK